MAELTVVEAAERIGCAQPTVRKWIGEGRLRARKSGAGEKAAWLVDEESVAQAAGEFLQVRQSHWWIKRSAAMEEGIGPLPGKPVTAEEWWELERLEWARGHHRVLPDGRVAVDANGV